ncbi:hypothetical protein R1flu_020475, partial [Riccia fluitans]
MPDSPREVTAHSSFLRQIRPRQMQDESWMCLPWLKEYQNLLALLVCWSSSFT